MRGLRTMTVEAGGALVKRIMLVVALAALMALISVTSAPAAFAHDHICTGQWEAYYAPGDPVDRDGDNVICGHTTNSGKTVFKDDHGYGGH